MKHFFNNTFFFIESNKLDCEPNEQQIYVIDLGLQKQYQHRTDEFKNYHGQNIFHEAYDKLADILVGFGFDVDIDDNWLRIFTTDEEASFNEVKQIVNDNINWLDEMFTV